MTLSADWPAPAKLNRFLHVVGRRSDGYHLLQTLFHLVDLGDSLTFEPTVDGDIRRRGGLAGLPHDADLVVRAARLLQRRSGCRRGAVIRVDKRLPAGGGLGGGSSDAATTLVALNHLWGAGFSADALADLGLQLGADVPVFIRGRSAWAEGVGEDLRAVDLPESWFVIIDPGIAVSTAEVFSAPELTRNTPRTTIRAFLAGEVRNDCEPVVRGRYPEVGEALDWLGGFAPARLTGTGGCLFAAFGRECDARAVAARVPREWAAFVARGMSRSPLLARLDAETDGSS